MSKIETPLGPGERSAGVDLVRFKNHAGIQVELRVTDAQVIITLTGYPLLKMDREFAGRLAAALELASRTGRLEVVADEI